MCLSRPVKGELEEKPAILVIDDELLVRNVVRMTLSRSGYHVLTASCGAEALKLSRAYPGAIHVAVIDVEWPYVIGTELATTILKEMPRIRVLLMTDKVARGIPLQLHWKLLLKPFLQRIA